MNKGKTPADLQAIEDSMNALRSALFKFSERQAEDNLLGRSGPLHIPLMNSIMTIQEAMKTFMSIAACINR